MTKNRQDSEAMYASGGVIASGRPVRDLFPVMSASRGGIDYPRWDPAEVEARHRALQRQARRDRWRRRAARPLHRLARPILRLAWCIGPECDRPRPRDPWDDG